MQQIAAKIARVVAWFLRPLTENIRFFLALYVMAIATEWTAEGLSQSFHMYDDIWWELYVDIYLLCAFITCLPRKVRPYARGTVMVFLTALTTVDTFCAVTFDSHLSPTMLMLALETDGREAGEFLTTYLSWDTLVSPAMIPVLIGALYGVTSLPIKALRRIRMPKLRLRYAAVGGTLALALFCVAFCLTLDNKRKIHMLLSYDNIGDVEHRLTQPNHGWLYVPVYRLAFSIRANQLTDRQIDTLLETADHVKIDSCSYRSPKIILIIGEAYNKHHSELYGYEKPTTPEQMRLKNEGSLIPFSDVITPWNLTSYVFKHLMTTYTVGDKGEWCDYPLFCQLFRKAGYKVTFLTNEFMSQANEKVYDFSGGFFINDPKLSQLQFDYRNKKLYPFDDGIALEYDRIMKKRQQGGDSLKTDHELTIFHLMGQHNSYHQRYPSYRRRFRPQDYEYREELTNERWRLNTSHYDNATLYNDSIVSAIVSRFKTDEAIVIYLPDHAEEVHPKEMPDFSGRFHSAEINTRLAREEFEIPFWIWCSETYRMRHPEIFEQIKAAKDKPYMSDALPHLLLYLAGINSPYYSEKLNILSPEYDATRPRIMKHEKDYDKLMGRK